VNSEEPEGKVGNSEPGAVPAGEAELIATGAFGFAAL
jgi:hypothetical protein